MEVASLLLELYGRIPALASAAVEGVQPGQLVERPGPEANTIAWLIWHLARVQDHHMAEILDTDQVWAAGDWARRFGLPPGAPNTGYGDSPTEVAAVRPESPGTLLEYLDAVSARTLDFLGTLQPGDLDRVVDRHFDPPVTLGVRLVSIADDCLQHAGQAAYLKGLVAAA
jgi:hypothetical protein